MIKLLQPGSSVAMARAWRLMLRLLAEQMATTVGLLTRAVGWFNDQGVTCRRVLSDNGSPYRSDE